MAVEKVTRAGMVYGQLRAEIFQGALLPGQRLRLVELAGRFSVSQSVVREALTRLAGQGLVVATPQQGFSVMTLSLKHLNELTEARTEIEPMVFRLSVRRGDIKWEAQAVAAHHHLAATPLLVDGRANDEWFEVHEQFHLALLEGCGNDQLLSVAMSLRDAAAVYRHWSHPVGHDYGRDVASEHEAILKAAVDRDADRAAGLLARHIDRTAEGLRAVAEGDEVGAREAGPGAREVGAPGVSA
ncbi:GntR family transcriptional regulator [Streptomyces sp. NBC_00687]|uniref:GntR family transcriptional regulator n=1 Tax=Streptomyces sp. NBC_00687 TaxID=2975807 RepID=UPI00225B07AC|nr:GntR family transcriptional regulator [Streptomyces sp. NBC_00687]MCX4919040.1 GntR family transcriptional regulator [Streptomyces sp. NBC_00687]